MLACGSCLGSVFVVGWSYRLAQRRALKRWWQLARGIAPGTSFEEFMSGDESTSAHARWPNWILAPASQARWRRGGGERIHHSVWRCVKTSTASLRANFWTGLQGAFNTWVLTLPPCVLMGFAWYDGWHNSFNKGYEQSFVGPVVSFVGIFLLIGAMYYVPLAQARQAVTGNWKAFYHFRLVGEVIRRRWLSSLGLAALYATLCVPVTIMKVVPMFWGSNQAGLEALTEKELVVKLNHYFFWCALYVFPAFALLRGVAARIYASAVVEGLRDGWICHESLGSFEARALERLNLVYPRPRPDRHPVLKIVTWAGTRLGRGVSYTLLFFVWFAFVAQTYIGEFLKFNSFPVWVVHPLVQLPWFRQIPSRMENPLFQVLPVLVVAAVAGFLGSLHRKWTRRGEPQPAT